MITTTPLTSVQRKLVAPPRLRREMTVSRADSESLYILRGFAIIVVVLAHVTDWPIQALHFCMPVFFTMSGYLFQAPGDLKKYLNKMAWKLLIPYFLFLFLVSIPRMATEYQSGGWETTGQFIRVLLIGGEGLKGIYAAFWFPPCFFFAHVAYTLMRRHFSPSHINLACLILLGMAMVNSYYFPSFWLPLALNVVFFAIPLLHAGYLYRHRQLSAAEDKAMHLMALAFGATYTLALYVFNAPYIQMKLAHYGWPVATTVAALAMVMGAKKASDHLQASTVMNQVFGNLGRASLIIMFAHQPIQMMIVSLLDVHHELFRIIVSIGLSYLLYVALEVLSARLAMQPARPPRILRKQMPG